MSRLAALILAVSMGLAPVVLGFSASQESVPNGQKGYEGQPGNQGGGNHNGLNGYEGQPGNQGGN